MDTQRMNHADDGKRYSMESPARSIIEFHLICRRYWRRRRRPQISFNNARQKVIHIA